LDEASNNTKDIPYYQSVYQYVKQRGGLVIINPGTITDEQYMSVCDIVMIAENTYANYVNMTFPSWVANYPSSRFAHLVHTASQASMTQAITLSKQRNAGYVYVTDDVEPNPWDTLPSYWGQELPLIHSGSIQTTPTVATTQPTVTKTNTPLPTSTTIPIQPTGTIQPTSVNTSTSVPPLPTPTKQPAQISALSQVTLLFNPVADAYVTSTHPNTNYGTGTRLDVRNSPVMRSYLRFNVKGLNGKAIKSATLRLRANTTSSVPIYVRNISNNTWTEKGVDYNNRPSLGSTKIMGPQSYKTATWISIDVTSLVKGEGLMSLALTLQKTADLAFYSRESGGNAPELIIVTAS
jgi:hypothetical protein